MSRDRLGAMQTFVRVVEAGSFSAAARIAGMSQSHVSKVVATLERRLATRLLNRTTRHLAPTEAGAAYYRHCKALLAAIEDAEGEVRAGQSAIRGVHRINTAAMLGGPLVLPALLAFRARHPAIRVETVAEDRRIDPVQEAADVLVRVGTLTDSSLVARRAGSAPTVLVAAPAYVERQNGPPRTVADLGRAEFITVGSRNRGPLRIELGDGTDAPEAVTIDGPVNVSNGLLAREATLAGAGITVLPTFLVQEDLTAGRLVRLLPDLAMPRLEISLLHPFGRAPPRKVSAFMELAVGLWRQAGLLAD